MRIYRMKSLEPGIPGAYVADGLVGLVVPRSPFVSGEARVNGAWEASEEYGSERIATVPFPAFWTVTVDGRLLEADDASFVEQSYDFSCAELETRLRFRVGGKEVRVTDLLFCPRTHPSVVTRRLVIESSDPVALSVRSRADLSSGRGRTAASYADHPDVDWCLLWECGGGLSTAGIAALASADTPGTAARKRSEPLAVGFETELPAGSRGVFTRLTSLVPGTLHPEPHWEALRLVRSAAWRGYEALREANRAAWTELWRSRIRLVGAGDRRQEAADAALFYLFSSAHPAAPCGIPPFGLSGSGYNGHVFWDTETFMYPVLLLTCPEAARSLLRYRTERLEAARRNAALNGYRGAMFPWESGLSGAEVTPVFAATSEEHHVTLDIAYACLQYAWAGEDRAFVRGELMPLLRSVCEWIESRSVRTVRGREIRNVVGIDEGIENIDNNAYTNIAAKLVLEGSASLARELGGENESDSWIRWADEIHIPVDRALGIIPKHEGYRYSGGPCVPETLAAFFPLTYRHPSHEIETATYDFHLSLADTVIHFPMLSSLFGVWAARRGDRAKSLECFDKGILEFVCEPYHGFSEWRGADRPMFLTNPAGFLNACLLGITGLQIGSGDPLEWGAYPVALPDGWERVESDRIWIRGRAAALRAVHGADRAVLTWDA